MSSEPFITTMQVKRRLVVQKEIYELEKLQPGDKVKVTVEKIKKMKK